jgi:hypothetical protein
VRHHGAPFHLCFHFADSRDRLPFDSLYRGFPPLLAKQLPYTVVQLSAFTFFVEKTYAYLEHSKGITKETLSKGKQLGISMACGVAAGVLSSLASQPGDTILSRINMAAKTGKGRRTIGEVYSELGFRGLWLGTGARCVFTGARLASLFFDRSNSPPVQASSLPPFSSSTTASRSPSACQPPLASRRRPSRPHSLLRQLLLPRLHSRRAAKSEDTRVSIEPHTPRFVQQPH